MHAVIQIVIKNDLDSCMFFGIHVASGKFFVSFWLGDTIE